VKPRYIFIVGLPRTGSKLLENILRNSSQINYESAGETHYVGHFITSGIKSDIKKIGDMSEDVNIHELLDYLYTGTPNKGFWRHLKRDHSDQINVDRKKFLQELLASDRTEKGIYEVILRIHTTVTDKTILGDKTGANLYHIATLVEWFPQAKIIHLLRDPRAILASEWKRRMKIYPVGFYLPVKLGKPLYSLGIVLHITIIWLYAIRLHRQYEKRYPQNYRLIRFEDLVSEPEKSVRELCEFLDIEFDPKMLMPQQVGSSFARERIVGFDKQTLTRWQNHLKPWMKIWMSVLGKKYFREFGSY
jgi:hypothetical protein